MRKRILRGFDGRGLLEGFEAKEMQAYRQSGFSLDTRVCIPDVDISSNLGILVPAGTPAAILDRLNSSLNRALAKDEIKAKLTGLGQMAVPCSWADFQRTLTNDVRRYASVVKEAGIRID
jgi:hypothetical protein